MAQRKGRSINARCIECDSRIWFKKNPGLGDRTVCPECDTHLEVIALQPLELDWAEDDYADYDDSNYSVKDDDYADFSYSQY